MRRLGRQLRMTVRVQRLAVAATLLCVALAARLVWWPRVFGDRGVVPPHGADEYYHLRRIVHATENFPAVLDRDAYVNFPLGGEIVWPPGFDFGIAALARLVGASEAADVVALAMWVPPLLGAFAVLAALGIAARACGWTAGWVAGALLALLPAAFRTTQLGMVDHHAAAALLSALLFGGAMHAARLPSGARWPRLALALGLTGAAFQLTWMGALLPLALLQGLAAVWMLQAPGPGAAAAVSRARHVGAAFAIVALGVVPFALGREWTQFEQSSPLVLSRFHPLWFATTAVACFALAELWRRTALGAGPGLRWASAAVAALLALPAFVLAAGDSVAALDTAAGWFRQDETFQHFVEELRPLFRELNGSRVAGPERLLTRLLYATPLVLVWLARRAHREGRADLWVLVAWTGAAALATLDQQRFLNSLCVPYAIVWGAALARLGERGAALLAQVPVTRRAAGLLAASALGVWLVAPSAQLVAARARVWSEGNAAPAPAVYPRVLAYRQAALWLRENSPATAGYRDASRAPEYGVLANWGFGHLVRFVAERPVVQDNFGVYGGREGFDAAERYYAATDEAEATALLDARGVRYVLVDRDGSGHARGYAPTSMTARLLGDIGAAPTPAIPALSRHRLRFETAPRRPGGWHVMLWEIVPGALIEGTAEPGAQVLAELKLLSGARSAPVSYRAVVRAAADGRYRLRVPYPSGVEGAVRTSVAYRIYSRGREAALRVSEAAVAGGERIAGPNLAAGR